MGEIPKQTGTEDGSNLDPSGLHGEDLARDTKIRDAVRNEGGVKSTQYARSSRETNELQRI